jgi:hypothetical protein
MSIMNNNLNPQPQTTRRIAGHDITLTEGHWYIASRPMATRDRATYPITIRDDAGDTALTIPDLTYDAANDLLAAFNDGPTSWDGRTW